MLSWHVVNEVINMNQHVQASKHLCFFPLCAAIRFDEIRVFGYTLWSLLDGFEWQDAYTTRRGLFYVDFNSKQKERKPKSSAHYYKQIIQENGFTFKESTPDVQGQFPCDFSWGVTESVLKVSGYLQINYKVGQIVHSILFHSLNAAKRQLSDNIKYHDYLEVMKESWGKRKEEEEKSTY